MGREPRTRKQLGAWYTPPALVDHLLDHVLEPLLQARRPGEEIRVLDPACGDARFLLAAGERIERAGMVPALLGVDIDRATVTTATRALGEYRRSGRARVAHGDSLRRRWGRARFDVVVGNPPFLTPLSSELAASHDSRIGGPYVDAAAEFLALACELAEPEGGRVGLVLPLSIVATRDADPVRRFVHDRAHLEWFWFAPRPVFDAEVRTCALGLRRGSGSAAGSVQRTFGRHFVSAAPLEAASPDGPDGSAPWSWLIADQLGVPGVPPSTQFGPVLGELSVCGADFRDEYYGLIGAVFNQAEPSHASARSREVPLVTSGLIDPGHCAWGERTTRFAKAEYSAPVVALDQLSGPMLTWADQRLVPKVLVASQTRVVEAVADPDGRWLPGVPVVSVTPHAVGDVWRLAAALTGPVPAAWLAARSGGSGLSAHALRISAPLLAQVPLPAGDLGPAVEALQSGDVAGCARANTAAYGISGPEAELLLDWWFSASKVPRETEPSARP